MKIKGLRKYTVFLLVCFFSLVTLTKAAPYETVNKSLLPNGSFTISSEEYIGFSCNLSEIESKSYFTVNPKITESGTAYEITYTKASSDGTASVVCQYTGSKAVGKNNESGQITYKIKYFSEGAISREYPLGHGVNSVNVGSDLNMAELVKLEVNTKGSEYIEVSGCDPSVNKTTCIVKLSEMAKDMDFNNLNNYLSTATITYKVAGSSVSREAELIFNINAFTGAWAWYTPPADTSEPGAIVCDMGGTWDNSKAMIKADGVTELYPYTTEDLNETLPNCRVVEGGDNPLTFKGWMPGVNGDTGVSQSNGGYQSSYIYAYGKCENAEPAGTKITANTNYSPCFEMNDLYVRLSLAVEGVIEDSNWTVSSSNYLVYNHKETETGKQVALPNVKFTGQNAENKSLQCWKKSNGYDNKCYKPGDLVDVDGSIYVAVTDTEHSEYSYFKTVKVNQSVVFAVDGMTTCNIGATEPSGYIMVTDYNGDCQVAGLKETGKDGAPEYVAVEVTLEGGTKKIYKFTVESDTGLTAAGNGEFIINPMVNTNEENAVTDSSGFKTSYCTTYTITESGSGVDISPNQGGFTLRSLNYSVTDDCDSSNTGLIAFCLDPGREGPTGDKYTRVRDIDAKSEFGKLINYIAENADLENFSNVSDATRVGAHVAIRVVALKTGMGSTSGMAYPQLFAPYQAVVNRIESDNPTTVEEYKLILTQEMKLYDQFAQEAAKFLAGYNTVTEEDGHGFERTIDSAVATANGSGYIITYKGTITAPVSTSNVELLEPTSNPANGLSYDVVSWVQDSVTETGRVVYKYELTITAADTLLVDPPSSEADKIEYAFRIKFDGSQSASSIFIAQPDSSEKALQRMIVFDTDADELYIYFNVAPNTCEDIPGLDYTQCTGADSCDNFNQELFKASGCCRYVTNERDYSYVVHTVCAGKCTTSTMANVCDYTSGVTGQYADLYEIKEGNEYNGSATEEGSGYKPAIGTCVTNVDKDIRTEGDIEAVFHKEDDNGNSISVETYHTNTYCRINCKEDWQFSMDAYGNYIGKKAIAAGSYFQIENDLFISGTRTCYTNYVDYDRYMNDLVVLSQGIITAYNEYSNLSHSYSDFKEEQASVDQSVISYEGVVEQYERTYTCTKSCSCPSDVLVCTDAKKTDCTTSCSQSSSNKIDENHQFSLPTKGTFVDAEAGEGQYMAFASDSKDTQSYMNGNGSGYTVNELAVEAGTPTSYGVDTLTATCSTNVCEAECEPSGDGDTCTVDCTDNPITCEFNVGISGSPYFDTDDLATAHGVMRPGYMEYLDNEMKGPRGTIYGNTRKIRQLIDEMFECQHFQLNNVTDENDGEYADTTFWSGKYYDDTKEFVKIPTAFDPDVTYEYAEDAFMTILKNNQEAYLVPYDEKNDAYYGGTEDAYKQATNESKEAHVNIYGVNDADGDGQIDTDSSIEVSLDRNNQNFYYYKIDSKWDPKSDEGREYKDDSEYTTKQGSEEISAGNSGAYKTKIISVCGITGKGGGEVATYTTSKGVDVSYLVGGSSVPDWLGGGCGETIAIYLEANYIKTSHSNSSFYRNQGYWYENIQDVKAHGDGLEAALRNENSNNNSGYVISEELNSERWSPIGIMNVFPISMTTPKNLYTYTYTFKDIGDLNGGDLGRIMGSETAIIANNNRTCFYEVFEELCLCCGDEINTYVYDNDDAATLIQSVLAHSGTQPSDPEKMEESAGGTLAFATSSVNLSDITLEDSGRDVATNWTNASPFIYGGEYDLTTGKGAELKTAIEEQGETIYATQSAAGGAEYSYHLTPTTLTKIREYNQNHGYEINYNNLIVYGRYPIAAKDGCTDGKSDSCWNYSDILELNEIINFQHYGSKFLEEEVNDHASATTLSKRTGDDNVCLIMEGSVDASTINSMMKNSNCRWIDYIENLDGNSEGLEKYTYPFSEGTDYPKSVTYFRLAFK